MYEVSFLYRLWILSILNITVIIKYCTGPIALF